jgi:nicotinate-nucleotide pyrophosphorylase (carboxylating)
MIYPTIPLEQLISFIREDAPFGDITTESIFPPLTCSADIIAKEDLLLAGLAEVIALFSHYGLETTATRRDGDPVAAGSVILSVSGDVHPLLLVERTALNLLGRMSGIASTAAELQAGIAAINPGCRIAATRKTAPGLRLIDKKAAMIGGADPHRFSLSDAVLIKDTHRTLVPLDEAIRRARSLHTYHLIEAEAESAEDAVLAAQSGADIILLDNMDPGRVQETLEVLEEKGLRSRVMIELSGGITPETIPAYAALGVDRISLGMLTHTVRNADFSLKIRQQR